MDNDVTELESVENICRLCLSADEPRSSVLAADKEEDSGVPLATKIQACLSIEISTIDKLSTAICASCVNSVNQWHAYKELCLRSQEKLQDWLTNHSQSKSIVTVKNEPEDVEPADNVEIIGECEADIDYLELSHSPVQSENDNETSNEQLEKVYDNDDKDADDDKEKDLETDSSGKETAERESDPDGDQMDEQDSVCLRTVKSEPQDDYDTDCTIEIESVNGSELLLNPMAVAAQDDTVMEADSTQKSNAAGAIPKKKLRRGPHTHFRGTRAFKQKCVHCQIFLHSKYTYMKHMKRFHNNKDNGENSETMSHNDEEEMVEDLEDELVSMEKDSPLTPVQQDIISQLKTFSCYTCDQTFNDRRSTLSHIRQHLPDLRPYTCIACLTEFADRSMYQLHCGASFECAMKIALVVPKHGSERYFTCNMCLRSMQGRKELLSHLSKHSDKQYEEMMSPMRLPPKLKPMGPLPSSKSSNGTDMPLPQTIMGPYNNGDPAHNHMCDLCGMIYKHLPNLIKHKQLCMQLQPEVRVSYKCVHCSMTFLVFKKFHGHITLEHKKKDFTCAVCNSKYRSPSDFLSHHKKHHTPYGSRQVIQQDGSKTTSQDASPLRNASYSSDDSTSKTRASSHKYNCGLCNQEFGSKAELAEHRTLHLKVKIYSCVICRSMFSNSGALEIHMKDHGIEDPKERNANVSCVEYGSLGEDVMIDNEKNTMGASAAAEFDTQNYECNQCGKVFTNYPNLKRHSAIAHRSPKIYECSKCSEEFTRKKEYEMHLVMKHKASEYQCPLCPEIFVFQSSMNHHLRVAHPESQDGYACDICGKVFAEETSLKIHKGWHNRANSRLSTRFILGNQKSPNDKPKDLPAESNESPERPARARKSFPNPPLQSTAKSPGNFQCQVCNDRFNDVTELRTHLWDVHCAKSKPEKSFTNDELQCELCTNVFPDREILSAHMRWHKANPILSDMRKAFSCDICGKSYSSKKVLWKHKRLHKATVVASIKTQSLARKPMASQFLCTICRKVFSSKQSLHRHKDNFHSEQNQQRTQQLYNSNRRLPFEDDEPKTKRPKLEEKDSPPKLPPFAMDFVERRKPVMCHLCKKMFPNMSILYKHKQTVHKPRKDAVPECRPISQQDGKYSCNICGKKFPGLPNLRQHFTIKHKKNSEYHCNVSSCDLVFPTSDSLKNHEQTHNNMLFSCKLCDRYIFERDAMMDHIRNVHNTVYQPDSKAFHREIDLNTYVVKDAIGTMCPRCNIKYPNNRAMKIHYFKIHENAD